MTFSDEALIATLDTLVEDEMRRQKWDSRCGNCTHWIVSVYPTDETDRHLWGTCNRVAFGEMEVKRTDLFYVVDASYSLHTHRDFGCVEWEQDERYRW